MADLPTSVRIGALDYKVKLWAQQAAENDGSFGLCDRQTCVILIKDTLQPQKACEVLLHEILHACYDGAGLTVGTDHTEERIVNALGYQWAQVLRDNPSLLAYVAGVFNHQVD